MSGRSPAICAGVLPLDPLIGLAETTQVAGYNIFRGSGSSLVGSEQRDILIGTEAAEEIYGLGGDDVIIAGRNNTNPVDTIDDADTFAGDTLVGGFGSDVLFSWFGNNSVVADSRDRLLHIEGSRGMGSGEPAVAANDAHKPFTSEDIEAAYKWMYGDDIWLKTFKELDGRVLAVDADGRWFSNWTIDWHYKPSLGPLGTIEGYDIKIEYDIGNVFTAAATLRQGIMSTARWDFRWTQKLQQDITDRTVYGDPVENFQTLRARNFEYAKEVAQLAATLPQIQFTLGIGDIADAILSLPGAVQGDVGSMLAMLPFIPGAVRPLGAKARALFDLGFEKFVMTGPLNDVLVRQGATLGFVLRHDLVGEAIGKLKISRIPTLGGKDTWLIGTAQEVPGTTHAATVMRKAMELAQNGNYSHVTMARNWRTATGRAGGDATSNLVPDIIAVRWDGKVVPFEVMSPGDTVNELMGRMRTGMDSLPETFRTDLDVAVNILPLDP